MLMTFSEARQLYLAVQSTKKVPGDIAEVGVYRGGSAKLICEAKGDRPLHLFDTFEGLPDDSKFDAIFHKGMFGASLEDVQRYLEQYENVHFYKGLFPKTAEPVHSKHFCFVHLDVDLWESILYCLEFFYPRLSKGGVMLVHDYPLAKGVKKAINEFFKDKPEPLIQPTYNQCLIVIV